MRIFFVLVSLFSVVTMFTTPSSVYALDGKAETGYKKGLEKIDGDVSGDNLPKTLQNIINTLLFFAGIAAVIIIIVGGLRFVTSEGDSNSTNRAKHTVIYASIGLVVVASSYALINFILDQLT